MALSNDLPTAVDYTNILVNYIEVSADDIPKGPVEEEKAPEGIYPPQVLHQGTEAKDHAPDSVGKTQLVEGDAQPEPVYWGKEVPRYLHDVDLSEHSKRYQRAAKAVNEFSAPPGLPLFLGKSILNGTTPMKDDNSVLNMPNHTVLNHLATSSIKNNVLATSITTRYKRKVVLLLMTYHVMRSLVYSMSRRLCTNQPNYWTKRTVIADSRMENLQHTVVHITTIILIRFDKRSQKYHLLVYIPDFCHSLQKKWDLVFGWKWWFLPSSIWKGGFPQSFDNRSHIRVNNAIGHRAC